MQTSLNTGGETWKYIYTADDERLIAAKSDGQRLIWTVRGLDGQLLTRDERTASGVLLSGLAASSSPGSSSLAPCPGGTPSTRIFCDGFESANTSGWSGTSQGANRRVTNYVWRGSQLVGSDVVDDIPRHFALDHLGTVRHVTNDVGEVVAGHDYYPFGREATPLIEDPVPMKFTGHERDLQSTPTNASDDYDYMHARFRSPLTGRFLSVDPVLGNSRNPQSWNRSSYTYGNPLKYVDPTGEYGRGFGFTDEQWRKFDKAQARAAAAMARRSAKLDKKADRLERKGRLERADDLRTAAGRLSSGAEVLRSDGADGYVANAVDSESYEEMGGSPDGAAFVRGTGPVVTVNITHSIWESTGMRSQFAIGHESLHSAGMAHQRGSNGAVAYKFGSQPAKAAFQELKGKPSALLNPDHLMDLVFP